jgi:hypothetical protein
LPQLRVLLAGRGDGYEGWKAAELFPTENAKAVKDTAERVSGLARELDDRGVAFLVLILPYEMQVSAEAAKKYWDFGLVGLSQKRLIADFAGRVTCLDAREAFLGKQLAPSGQIGLGQYFVYKRGDKLDWNHPNRAEDRIIADWLANQPIFKTLLEREMARRGYIAGAVATPDR